MSQIRIIINTPHVKNSGGIANLYDNLRAFLGDEVKFNYITYYLDKKPRFDQQIILYIKFVVMLLKYRNAKVMINPSFNFRAVRRDAIYLLIAWAFHRKSIVFWHGWIQEFYDDLYSSSFKRRIFTVVYSLPQLHFTLASEFAEKLRRIGVRSRMELMTTCVDRRLIEEARKIQPIRATSEYQNLLFISRLVSTKGVYESLEAFRILKQRYPNLKLTIAGSGREESQLKKIIADKDIEGVVMEGYVKGRAKAQCYLKNHVLLFPSYTEGMPLTVLEAMSFGLVILTSEVGGIKDFFTGEMGSFVRPRSVESIVREFEAITKDANKIKKISEFNIRYAHEHFMAEDIAAKLRACVLDS